MTTQLIVVKAARDEDAHVWFVESSDLPGLNVEADTLEELIEKIPGAIQDLVEEGGAEDYSGDLPIEVVAHAGTRVRLPAAA
jgi:predicted RNase H-like HicB family nuclease